MKRALALALVASFGLLPAGGANADGVPATLPFQGVLVSSSGVPVDGTFDFTISLYDASSGGNLLYSTPANGVVVSGGVFDVVLGPIPAATFVLHKDVFVEVAVKNEPPLPRRQLMSVPYAVQALRADTAGVALGLSCSECVAGSALAPDMTLPGTTTVGDLLVTGKVGVGKTPTVAIDVAGAVKADSFIGLVNGMSPEDASLLLELIKSPAIDLDGDGLPNSQEAPGDADGDGTSNLFDKDADGDGVDDGEDPAPTDPAVKLYPVTAFTATANGGTVSLAWTKSKTSTATYTRIVRKTTGYPTTPTDGTVVKTTDQTTWDDSGLSNGTFYYAAFASDGTDFSAPVNAPAPQVVDLKALVWAADFNATYSNLSGSWVDLPSDQMSFTTDFDARMVVAMSMGGNCNPDGCHGSGRYLLDGAAPGPSVLYMGGPGQWHQSSTNYFIEPTVAPGSHVLKMQHACGTGPCNMNSNGERSFFAMAVPPDSPDVRVFGTSFEDTYSNLPNGWTSLNNNLTFDLAVESDVLIAFSSGGHCNSDGCHGYHRYLLDNSKTSQDVIYMGGPGQWHQSSVGFSTETLGAGSHALKLQHTCGAGTCNLNSNGERGFMVVSVPKGSPSYRVFSARFTDSQSNLPSSWVDVNNTLTFNLAQPSDVIIGLTGGGYCSNDGCHGAFRYRVDGGAPSNSTLYMGGPGQWHEASTNFFKQTLGPGDHEIRLEHSCGTGPCHFNVNAIRSLMVLAVPSP